MRRATIFLLVVLAAAVPAAQAQLPRPSGARLDVLREQPVVVRGERFKSDEHVTVVLVAQRRWTRSTTADESGDFRVRFTVSMDCERYSLQAFGSKGSRARTLPRPQLDC